MKLTQNKIDEIILEIAGPDGLRLVRELKNKENVSEFSLATKLKKDIKLIRNLLYKLYNYNLISSIRKKDKQKGWYIYYWTLIPENIKFLYIKNKKIIINKLKEQLEKEQTEQFYTCSKKCIRLNFDQAIDFEFRCPECGELISQHQDPKIISNLEKEIDKLEKELKSEEKTKITPKRKKVVKSKKKVLKKVKVIKKIKKKKNTLKKTSKKNISQKNKKISNKSKVPQKSAKKKLKSKKTKIIKKKK